MCRAKQRIARQDDGVNALVAGLGPRQPEREFRSRLPETRLPPTRARPSFTRAGEHLAGVIQLVECQLPKLDVTGSSPVARSLEVVVTESLPRARARMGPGVFLTGPVSRVRRTRL